ncbi:MAG: translocation/assembly module TamB [Treponema sp.]|nr:translocation/assembly module TamB [Treponema sp.]
MKIARVKAFVSILIFLALTTATYAVIRPVYQGLGKFVRTEIEMLNSTLENKFGLKASYSSMSPSILSGITLKGIEVIDTQSQKSVLEVKKVRLNFSVWDILTRNFDSALKDISFSDVNAELVEGENSAWLDKILENLSGKEVQPKKEKISVADLLKNKSLEIKLPCNFYFYNINAAYRRQGISAAAKIRNVDVEKTAVSGKYNIEFIGSVNASAAGQNISTTVFFQSSFNSHIENSSAVIQLFNAATNDFSISQVGFYAEYHNLQLAFKMLPTVKSVYMEASADLEKSTVDLFLDTRNFYITNLIQFKKKNSLDVIKSIGISVNASLNFNYETSALFYKSHGNVNLPKGLVPGGLNVQYSVSGNKWNVNVPYIKGSGDLYDFEYNGSYNIPAMQPSGSLNVYKVALPNGNQISTELYFEPLKRGFMCFAPQIMFGEKSLTAAQLNFVPNGNEFNFDFEVSDYSHFENENPAKIRLNGSYQGSTKYLQASASVDTFYVDSVMQFAAFFLDKNQAGLVTDLSKTFKNTIFNTDVFIQSYAGNFSYSIPYAIMADTMRDEQMVVLALDGNKDTIQLRKFDMNFAGQKLSANAHSETISDPSTNEHQTIVTGKVDYNSIPYTFSGLVNKDWISFTGDYGFSFSFSTDKDTDSLIGSLGFKEFPVKLSDSTTLSFNVDTSYSYDLVNRMNINIRKFEIQSISALSTVNPTFSANGFMDKTGFYLSNLGYSDTYSNLAGQGNIVWTFENDNFVNADVNIGIKNVLVAEELSFVGTVSNPENKPLTTSNFLQDYYVTAQLNVHSFRMNRFVSGSNPADSINAEVSVTGTLSNPFVSVSIPRGTMTINGSPLALSASAVVEDKVVELRNASVDYAYTQASDIHGTFSLREWAGELNFNVKTYLAESALGAAFNLAIKGVSAEDISADIIPEMWDVTFSTQKFEGEFIKNSQPIFIRALVAPGQTIISSSDNIGLSGTILSNGELNLGIHNGIPMNLNVNGNIKSKNVSLSVSDIDCNLGNIMSYFNIPEIKIFDGHLTGAFSIIGPKEDLGFYGQVKVTPAEITLEHFFKGHAKAPEMVVNMNYNLMTTEPIHAMLKRSPIDINMTLTFNSLAIETFNIFVKTVGDTWAPLNMNMDQVHIKGNTKLDLEIVMEPQEHRVTVTGDITAKDTNCELGTSRINEVVNAFVNKKAKRASLDGFDNLPPPMAAHVMLNITALTRVQVSFSSFIRGIVVPNNSIVFTFSSDSEKVGVVGEIPLKSGEIVYLNNAFYIKEGILSFPANTDGIDPYITLRAETKVFDDRNEEVTIGLKINHQRITELAPVLTATPARSEKEISELLGHFVSGNSENMGTFMLATGDFALQLMVVRRVENALRDFFNFDILSIRTAIVQNALKQTFRKSRAEEVSVGNYLDNTTVYIGKYFGSALYTDFMLRLVYDKNRVADTTTLRGLMFKPEIGFEMASPIGNIRASLAPDISRLMQQQLGINPSLTLSWKFNF